LSIPEAKIPQINLPTIRIPIHIPKIGCPGADARSYVGEQFGNLPDLVDAFHVKHLRKVVNDQIFALLKGQLPTILRKGLYLQKAVELIQDVVAFIQVLNQVIGAAIAEYNATIGFINTKISQLNQSIAEIQAIPEGARTAVNTLALQRFNEYIVELNQQKQRLQRSIMCIME
jgi:hypothetical protein